MTTATSDTGKIAACNAILDRAYGKSIQPHDGDGQGGAIDIRIESLNVQQLRSLVAGIDQKLLGTTSEDDSDESDT
jgi:hypothetical protein